MDHTGSRPAAIPASRYGIVDLVRSEWTKLRTVRSTTWTLGLTVVIGIGISALATAETRAHWSTMSPVSRATLDPTQISLAGTFFCQLVLGVLGVLVMSSEYTTGTIRATFAAAPRRPLVLLAKVLVFGGVVLALSEAVALCSFFLGQVLLSAPATHASLSTPGAVTAVVGTGLYLCVMGLFALALATLIRHTAGAVSAYVGILLVLPLIMEALPSALQNAMNRFWPAVIGSRLLNATTGGTAFTFSPWVGFAVLCGYTFVLLVIGGLLLVRRDA
ncbi:MAG: ABC transporter permease subunit [Acidimicrobiales bacterium]